MSPCLRSIGGSSLTAPEAFHIYIATDASSLPDPFHIISSSLDLLDYTSKPEGLDLAKRWYRTCIAQHPECYPADPWPARLPKRVLYISPLGRKLSIKLLETTHEVGRWVALSHRWPREGAFETNRENLGQRLHNVDFDDMPPTFQDAVTFTRELGIEYLWIDSLCIIQDDAKDWRMQAPEMADVYQNAFLEIAAAGSKTQEHGFLGLRDSRDGVLPVFDPEISFLEEKIRYRPVIDHDDTDTNPLHGRAWVFQERLLSRRLLSFCSREMTWQCEKVNICECGEYEQELSRFDNLFRPMHVSESPLVLLSQRNKYRKVVRDLTAQAYAGSVYQTDDLADTPYGRFFWEISAYDNGYPPEDRLQVAIDGWTAGWTESSMGGRPLQEPRMPSRDSLMLSLPAWIRFYRYWRKILVPTYTSLELTIAADRLIALSGIAADICYRISDRYLAGLWLNDIEASLAWISTGTTEYAGCGWLPEQYRAPSWSWASVEGRIKYDDDTEWYQNASYPSPVNIPIGGFHPAIDVIDHKCDTPGKYDVGQVMRGSITLKGSLIAAELQISAVTEGMSESAVRYTFSFPSSSHFVSGPLEIDFSPDVPLVQSHDQLDQSGALRSIIQRSGLRPGEGRGAVKGSISLLLLGETEKDIMIVLVLTASTSSPTGRAYERLGIGRGRLWNLELLRKRIVVIV